MSKSAGQRADDFHPELLPQAHGQFVRRDHIVELQRAEAEPARFGQAMLTHGAADPLPARIRSNDEPGVRNVRAPTGLVGVQSISTDDSVFVFSNVNISVALKPISQRLFARRVSIERIRFPGRDHFTKNFPNRLVIGIRRDSNVEHDGQSTFKTRDSTSAPLIGFRIPKWSAQADRGEDRHHFIRRRPARFEGEPISVPMDGKLPELLEIDQRSPREFVSRAPKIDRFFRPEEEHRRSGENNVVPPMRGRNREVRDIRPEDRLIVFHFQRQRLAGETVRRGD